MVVVEPVGVRILVVAVGIEELVGLVVDRRFVHFDTLAVAGQDRLAVGSTLGRTRQLLVAQLVVRVWPFGLGLVVGKGSDFLGRLEQRIALVGHEVGVGC